MRRIVLSLLALLVFAQAASAQESHVSVGGSAAVVTQPHADDQPMGGTTHGWSALFSVHVSPSVAIEVEPSFDGEYSDEYTYRPFASGVATVVATRRDTVIPVQARFRAGTFEPVIGIGIVRSKIARLATVPSGVYFDDSRSDNNLAVVGGLDVALKVASHVYLVPTFRVRIGSHGSDSANDPLGEQTRTGSFNLRYGVGARVGF